MANTLIHESRRLLLPFDTVVDALIELDIKHGRWPSNAELLTVAMHDGEDDSARSVVLTIRPARESQTVERTYTLPSIAAAIVNYCLTMRVPMPRSSTKTIRIVPEGIVLQLENTLMLQRRHAEAPPVTIVSAQTTPPAGAETSVGDGAAVNSEARTTAPAEGSAPVEAPAQDGAASASAPSGGEADSVDPGEPRAAPSPPPQA